MFSIRILPLVFLFEVCFCFNASSQKTEVTVTPPFKKEDNSGTIKTPNGFIAYEQTGIAARLFNVKLEKLTYGIKLVSFDNNMKVIKEVKLENGAENFGPFNPRFKEQDGKYYLIYYRFGANPSNQYKVLAAEIDPVTLALKDEQLIISTDVKGPEGRGMTMLRFHQLQFTASPDGNRLAVLSYSGIGNEYDVSVLSKDLNQLWQKHIITKYKKDIVGCTIAIDNKGMVYSTYRSDAEADKVDRILAIDERETLEEDIVLDGVEPHRVEVVASTGSTPAQIVGTYKSGTDNVRGIFHQRITSQLQGGATTRTEFSEKQLDKLNKEDWGSTKSSKYGAEPFYFDAIRMENDDVALTGEFRRVEFGAKSSYVIAGSVVVAMIANGKPSITILPKTRVSAGTTVGDSYVGIAAGDRLVIFYNDYPKNLEKPIDGDLSKTSMFNLCVLAAAILEKDGTFTRFQVLDMKKDDFLMIPEQAYISDGTIQIPGVKYSSMGKLKSEGVIASIILK